MTNIQYSIKEVEERNTEIDLEILKSELDKTYNSTNIDCNEDYIFALSNHYFTNYTAKQLHLILEFYKINKHRLKKKEVVDLIVKFETNDRNNDEVNRRILFWEYIRELKNEPYFDRYILFDI